MIHFAGLRAVWELLQRPLCYPNVNLGGARQLVAAMQDQG